MRVLCLLLCVSACLRPAEERALLDLEVGRRSADGVTASVNDGLAQVRELGATAMELWAQAPQLDVELSWQTPPASFDLTLVNAMPDAVLVSTDVAATEMPTARPTLKTWRLLAPPSSVRLRLGPSDASDAAPFRFAVLSDVQEAINEVEDVWRRINEQPGVRFVIGAGDLTERGSEDELLRFQRELELLAVPYFATVGNHELGSDAELWPRYFGRASFQFFFHEAGFTLLDSASATIDPRNYQRLDGWLLAALDRLHIVAMHIAPVDPIGVRNGSFGSRDEGAKLLGRLGEGGVDLTLYGHVHSYYSFFNAGIPAYISGGGGAIPERFDNVGRHFLVVDVDPGASTLSVRLQRVSDR